MTTLRAESGDGSWLTGQVFSPQSAKRIGAEIIYREFTVARPLPLKRTRSLSDVMAALEADVSVAKELPSARKVVGESLYGAEARTLAAMRLRAGLSQSQLAAKVGTSQPHLARIERGQCDPGTDLIVRLAAALDIDPREVFAGVRAHRSEEAEPA